VTGLLHVVLLAQFSGSTSDEMKSALDNVRDLGVLDAVDWIVAGKDVSVEGMQTGFTHAIVARFAGPSERDRYLSAPSHIAAGKQLANHAASIAIIDVDIPGDDA